MNLLESIGVSLISSNLEWGYMSRWNMVREYPSTNVTQDYEVITGKIALAHLNEFPDYYTRLQKMETEAENTYKTNKSE